MIDLHAVLGAFVIGTIMPRGVISRDLIGRIQPSPWPCCCRCFSPTPVSNTKITLLNTGFLWLMCGAVLVAAIPGKGVACWLAARATGIPNREALGIGTLMNARGLMELIIINIGLQRGIISEGLFAVLVIMAIITTLMASPVFDPAGRISALPRSPKKRKRTALPSGQLRRGGMRDRRPAFFPG